MKRPNKIVLGKLIKDKKVLIRIAAGVIVLMVGLFAKNTWMDVQASKSFYGTLEVEESSVCAKTAGVIKTLEAAEGDSVKAGDAIGQIDAYDDALRLEQSKLVLDSAENDLAAMDEGARQEEIAIQQATIKQLRAQYAQSKGQATKMESLIRQAKANMNSAESLLKQKEEAYTDAKALFDAGAVSEESLTNAKTLMDTATNALEGSKAALSGAEADLSSIRSQADALNYQVQAAESKLEMLKNGATDRSIQTGKYNIDKSKLGVDLATSALEKTMITSMVSGRIQSLNYHVGEYVVPGSIIATIADDTQQTVKIHVPEKFLPALKVGQKLEVLSTVGSEKAEGIIVHISDKAIYTPLNIVTVKDREKLVFEVKLKIEKPNGLIKAGSLVEVRLP